MLRPPILIVESDLTLAHVLGNLLWSWGYKSEPARDAGEALAAIQREMPAVMIVDIELPGLDGLQLTRAIKGDPQRRRIPVIAIHVIDRETEDAALAAGCVACLGKPMQTDRMHGLLRVLAPLPRS